MKACEKLYRKCLSMFSTKNKSRKVENCLKGFETCFTVLPEQKLLSRRFLEIISDCSPSNLHLILRLQFARSSQQSASHRENRWRKIFFELVPQTAPWYSGTFREDVSNILAKRQGASLRNSGSNPGTRNMSSRWVISFRCLEPWSGFDPRAYKPILPLCKMMETSSQTSQSIQKTSGELIRKIFFIICSPDDWYFLLRAPSEL